jgi:hypothetical protein
MIGDLLDEAALVGRAERHHKSAELVDYTAERPDVRTSIIFLTIDDLRRGVAECPYVTVADASPTHHFRDLEVLENDYLPQNRRS